MPGRPPPLPPGGGVPQWHKDAAASNRFPPRGADKEAFFYNRVFLLRLRVHAAETKLRNEQTELRDAEQGLEYVRSQKRLRRSVSDLALQREMDKP